MPQRALTIFTAVEFLVLVFSVAWMTFNMATKPSNHNLNGQLLRKYSVAFGFLYIGIRKTGLLELDSSIELPA